MVLLLPSLHACWQRFGVSDEDAVRVLRSTLHGSVTGFAVGGFFSAAETAKQHIAANADTRYVSQKEAQRTLNDAVLKEFGRTGSRWGWRTGGFLGVFTAGIVLGESQRGSGLVRFLPGGGVAYLLPTRVFVPSWLSACMSSCRSTPLHHSPGPPSGT